MMADDILTRCAETGITLAVGADGLRYRGPVGAMTTELRAELGSQRDEIMRRLAVAAPAVALAQPSARRKPAPPRWSPEIAALADFVQLLTPDDLPTTPFQFSPGCQVIDRAKFLAALQADVRRGPSGPRARYGAVQGDLRQLREILFSIRSGHERF